jgi:hypothetical protein
MRFQKEIMINEQEAAVLAFFMGTVQGALARGLPVPEQVLTAGGIEKKDLEDWFAAVRAKFAQQAAVQRL